MKIGNVEIKGFAALAPMAGVADRAMREICMSYGAAFSIGELTSAKAVVLGDGKSASLLACFENERPAGCQLFGSEPEIMARAAEKALEYNPDFIDINMGCPAPKVAGNGAGSALMKNPYLAAQIVERVCEVSSVPVTVKMRTGIDKNNINAPELAVMCEQAGASTVTVHGRTKAQMYAPDIDFETVAEVKRRVKIPVIANGDICDGKSAEFMMKSTGCDFLMVGRAAMGNPFVFEEINAFFEGREYKRPSLEDRLCVCQKQIKLMMNYKNERVALLEARKHTAWYMNGINGAAAFRRMCGEINCFEDVLRICEKALEQNRDM